ncbi:MAG: hypothetical protein JW981_10055, partial [Anaerolineae bacterium]|nr:hypothetical protein [Anaerolineae bacterium]
MRKKTRDFNFNMGNAAVELKIPWYKKIWDFLRARVRLKIILPYLSLTLLVMLVGVYLLTSLIAGSHGERLNNQLQQSGVVVSTVLARREVTHREFTRRIEFTEGFRVALSEKDVELIEELVTPIISAESTEFILIVDEEGQPLLHMIRQEGEYIEVQKPFILEYMWIIRDLLELGPANSDPKVALGLHPETNAYYYFTAIPVLVDDGEKLAGVITVGTSLDSLLALFKSNASADVTVYLEQGKAIASTFEALVAEDDIDELLLNLSLPPAVYEKALGDINNTQLREWEIEERDYRLAIGAL